MRPRSSTSTSSAARRYLAVVAIGLLAAYGVTAAFIYVQDPLQVLRPSRGAENLYLVPEYQVAGIVRQHDYDAIVLGTSVSVDLRSQDLARTLGWRAINIALAGSTIREQRAVLDLAISTGKVKHVLWPVDWFAFKTDEDRGFPYYLYRAPGWRMAPYFLSLDMLLHGLVTLVSPNERRVSLARWDEERFVRYRYGKDLVLTAWEHRDSVKRTARPAKRRLTDAVEEQVTQAIRANPTVDFQIVLLPYSSLYYKLLADERPFEFDENCEIDRAIVSGATALPNAAVHDFRDAREFTEQLDRFKDLMHFSPETSRQIVEEVASGRRRTDVAAFAPECARMRAAASAYPVPAR